MNEPPHEKLLDDYVAALNTHDWAKVAPLVDEDAVFIFSEGTFVGKPAIQQAIEKTFALIANETYVVRNQRWSVVTDRMACCYYEFAWSGLIGGKPANGHGRGTSVVCLRDGVWVVAHEHLGPPAA
ncbi:MAG: nuclear transport factor 2 family protein [Verrucomicrobia bacterium]|nr:nuclear transport factor 2 family protein [Verrucomicrobiota bacterium]